jgi:membrane protein YdbS with pleckstrin-like domain
MPYPDDALAPHEELILNLHPHWWYIAKAGIVLALTIILAGGGAIKVSNGPLSTFIAVIILVEVGWFLVRFVKWISTYFVLTSDRVMSREGVFAKRGIEIPLERINTVLFQQGIFERILGLGDLEIESASKEGAQRFEDVRRPSDIQKEVYIQMERNDNRKTDRMGQVIAGAGGYGAMAPPAGGAPSIADQVNQLAQLRDQGHITEAEFQAKKAELLNRM